MRVGSGPSLVGLSARSCGPVVDHPDWCGAAPLARLRIRFIRVLLRVVNSGYAMRGVSSRPASASPRRHGPKAGRRRIIAVDGLPDKNARVSLTGSARETLYCASHIERIQGLGSSRKNKTSYKQLYADPEGSAVRN